MSITLTNNEQLLLGGVLQEQNLASANMDMDINYTNTGSAVFTFKSGNVAGSNLQPGAHATSVSLVVDLTSGNWRSSNGLSGTISQPVLANFMAQFKVIRNAAEQFAAATGIVIGTFVTWP